ncbi:hypothetical protein K439DRAFT_1527185 [Ramaria rubella]|nr:hypothetical protein K439DRAFT_1527185 [Ramaria rubella]
MSNLHAYFALRNHQGFAKALDGSRSHANTPSQASATPGLSSSGGGGGGRSWTRSSTAHHIDVNAKDWLGRTVLHLACAAPEPWALAYVRLLLAHPHINVNIQDTESRWTPLHRALYIGNIAACQLLLQRGDIDVHIRDYEGFTPFDLYNSTIDGTGPASTPLAWDDVVLTERGMDLFTWGANRNAALGHGDSDDRTYPDQVVIERPDTPTSSSRASDKLAPIKVRAIAMAKLHTTIITTEPHANLRACGFGSGGRLGPTHHTQYTLRPLPHVPRTPAITALALGQDHTLALTAAGEVLSWGLNRFAQLGYVVEGAGSGAGTGTGVGAGGLGGVGAGAGDEPIQAVAKRVVGVLRRERVVGVAACKTASACWTEGEVFTWGTNYGQLGYDCVAQPVQILPRKVTGVQSVTAIAMTDTAMACLLETNDVICFKDNTHFRVKFPIPELTDNNTPPYAHPFLVKPPITKITSCDGVFGALSVRGDVFTWAVPEGVGAGAAVGKGAGLGKGAGTGERERERGTVKPQRVWALRKAFDPATDIALGPSGTVILCTAAGHVFTRSRTSTANSSSSSSSPFKAPSGKFTRVPYIHRAVRVCANSAGAFGALRLGYEPRGVGVVGGRGAVGLGEDLRGVRPWVMSAVGGVGGGRVRSGDEATEGDAAVSVASAHVAGAGAPWPHDDEQEDTEGDALALEKDVADTTRLCALLVAAKTATHNTNTSANPDADADSTAAAAAAVPHALFRSSPTAPYAHGADILLHAGSSSGRGSSLDIPAHRAILAARSAALRGLIERRTAALKDAHGSITIKYRPASDAVLATAQHGHGGGTELPRVTITGCSAFAALLLLEHLYSDDVPAVWDRRVEGPCRKWLGRAGVLPGVVKKELGGMAGVLGLEALGAALEGVGKRVPGERLGGDVWALFRDAGREADAGASAPAPVLAVGSAIRPDVFLELADRRVACHSVVLRARCPFFRSFLDDGDWTVRRWTEDGTLEVDMRHMEWRAVEFAMRWMYSGEEAGLFERLDSVETVQELLDLVFAVMAVASELLLDNLMLICSATILRHVTLTNVPTLLNDATYYNALPLVDSLQDYIACNLEPIMESRLLDATPPDLIKSLSAFVRTRQAAKSPATRSNLIAETALRNAAAWLEMQDIPAPIVRTQRLVRDSPKLSPIVVDRGDRPGAARRASLPPGSPAALGKPSPPRTPKPALGDDIFAMEDVVTDTIPALNIGQPQTPPPSYVVPRAAWKASPVQGIAKVDMKTIMAETATTRMAGTGVGTGAGTLSPSGPSTTSLVDSTTPTKWMSKTSQRQRRRMEGASSEIVVSPEPLQRGSGSGSGSPWRLPTTPTATSPPPVTPRQAPAVVSSPPPGPGSSRQDGPGPLSSQRIAIAHVSKPQPPTPATPMSIFQASASTVTPPPKPAAPKRYGPGVHSDAAAWTPVPVHDPVPVTGLSFAAIQQLQRDQNETLEPKGKRSLRDIQAEERAKQEEEDFLRWWTAEEQRVKAEAESEAQGAGAGAASSSKRERVTKGLESLGFGEVSDQGQLDPLI